MAGHRKRNREREENPYLRPEDVIQEFPEEDEVARRRSQEFLEQQIEAKRAELIEGELHGAPGNGHLPYKTLPSQFEEEGEPQATRQELEREAAARRAAEEQSASVERKKPEMVDAETQLLRPSIDASPQLYEHPSNGGMLTIEPKEVTQQPPPAFTFPFRFTLSTRH